MLDKLHPHLVREGCVAAFAGRDAFKNLSQNGARGRWASGDPVLGEGWDQFRSNEGADRVFGADPAPIISPKFKLPAEMKIFASGSCFAREIERALFLKGKDVLSWTPNLDGIGEEYFHRYTTQAIINDFSFALNGGWSEDNIVKVGDQYVDYTGYGKFSSLEDAAQTRRAVIDIHRKVLEADVLFITLGLVETWFDKSTSTYTNTVPYGQIRGDRYELRVTDFRENLEALRRFIDALRQHRPDLKIVLTVSPVPLRVTFSSDDVVVANTYSKSVLRAVAQEIVQADDLIDYFPSYEMVTLANPDAAWLPDRRHVRREFVAKIIDRFMTAYSEEA